MPQLSWLAAHDYTSHLAIGLYHGVGGVCNAIASACVVRGYVSRPSWVPGLRRQQGHPPSLRHRPAHEALGAPPAGPCPPFGPAPVWRIRAPDGVPSKHHPHQSHGVNSDRRQPRSPIKIADACGHPFMLLSVVEAQSDACMQNSTGAPQGKRKHRRTRRTTSSGQAPTPWGTTAKPREDAKKRMHRPSAQGHPRSPPRKCRRTQRNASARHAPRSPPEACQQRRRATRKRGAPSPRDFP